jgi:hypothetical protein
VTAWFAGSPLPSETDERFAAAFRAAGDTWSALGISQEHTSAWPGLGLVEFDLHAIDEHDSIRLHAQCTLRRDGFEARADWSFDAYVMDGAPGGFSTAGSSLDEVAAATIAWVAAQFARPLLRETWRRDGRVVSTAWSLEEPHEIWRVDGFSLARIFRRPPDDVERLR